VKNGTVAEWTIVFWIAAVVALLPVFFFSIWGSADRQHWASNGVHRRSRRKQQRRLSLGSNTVCLCVLWVLK
jgi:hypothetical protein